jgi:3-(3-hydroxy-phenyl)propionate hydroxylase
MAMIERHPVIVAGAGPTGLTAALALRAQGIPALLIEADPQQQPRPGTRATFIHNEPLAELERLHSGLGQALIDEGMLWTARRYFYRGREFYTRRFAMKPGMSYGTSLPQTVTERILRQACHEAGVEFRWGIPVSSVSTTANGATVLLGSGEQFESEFVIGADGARSVVRSTLGIQLIGERASSRWVVIDLADVPEVQQPPELEFHYLHPGLGGRNILIIPFKGGWRLDIECSSDEELERLSQLPRIREWLPNVLNRRYADCVSWVSTYRFNTLAAERFCDGHRRALLIGDAAHQFPPWGGRGLNSGVMDAVSAVRAIARSLANPSESDRYANVDAFDSDRRDAAHFNMASAAIGAHLMLPQTRWQKLSREWLALRARWSRKAAYQLSSGPNGRAGGRPGMSGVF